TCCPHLSEDHTVGAVHSVGEQFPNESRFADSLFALDADDRGRSAHDRRGCREFPGATEKPAETVLHRRGRVGWVNDVSQRSHDSQLPRSSGSTPFLPVTGQITGRHPFVVPTFV